MYECWNVTRTRNATKKQMQQHIAITSYMAECTHVPRCLCLMSFDIIALDANSNSEVLGVTLGFGSSGAGEQRIPKPDRAAQAQNISSIR